MLDLTEIKYACRAISIVSLIMTILLSIYSGWNFASKEKRPRALLAFVLQILFAIISTITLAIYRSIQ